MENFTESDVQQRWRNVVLDLQTVPQQAFLSVPAESVSTICLHPLKGTLSRDKNIFISGK
jgi:hypothetical protein